LNVSTQLAVNITNACCVLHNFVREKNGIDLKDSLSVECFEEIDLVIADRGGRTAINMRNV